MLDSEAPSEGPGEKSAITAEMKRVAETVPETVRRLTKIAGLTNANVAHYLGISRQVVQMRMAEVSKWQFDELASLAALFGVPVGVLYEDTPKAIKAAVKEFNLALRFVKGKRLTNREMEALYGAQDGARR